MRRGIVAGVVFLLLATAACNSDRTAGPTGVPNPPFLGPLPEDVYVYPGETGTYGGELVLAQPTDLQTLNPITATGTNNTYSLLVHVYRCLVDYRNGAEPPDFDLGLCKSWDISPDGKEWTFHLRRGISWSDGEPFTADDVIFTYDAVCDPQVESSLREIFRQGVGPDGKPLYPIVTKLDDYTVRFSLHVPNGGFMDAIYNLWLIPKHKWESVWRAGKLNEAMKLTDDPNEVVALGPFRVKQYVPGQRIELERNPYFWKVDKNGNRLPYLDRIIFVIAHNYNTIHSKFQGGELDGMWRVRAEEYELVKRLESEAIKVEETGISYDTAWIAINLNNSANPRTGRPYVEPWKQKLFRNLKFRQAISYAIDREGIVTTVFAGRAVPNYSFVTPGDKIWYSGTAVTYPYDPALAKQLLGEIGMKDSDGDGFLEDADGRSVDLLISANAGNSERVAIANLVADSLKRIGLRVRPDLIPFQILLQKTENTFDFDMVVGAWQSGTPPSPNNTKNILFSSAPQHVSFPKQKTPSTEAEAQIDQLLHQLEGTTDKAERKRIYGEVSRIWSEQLLEINLVAERHAVAYKTKFGNIKPSPLFAHLTWNCEEIYLKQQ